MDLNFKTLNDYKIMLDSLGLLVSDNSSSADFGILIKGLTYNSKKAKEDGLFICKGLNFREEYLMEALNLGACAYICEDGSLLASKDALKKEGHEVPRIIVRDMRMVLTKLGSMFYDDIWNEKLMLIGITGTKGKSTTACFVKAIMDEYYKAKGEPGIGFLSGIYTFDGGEPETARKITTPETLELQEHLVRCVDNGLKGLVMETSSQALKYRRSDALDYRVCAFLNIAEDHISEREHPTFEDYFESKLKIFSQSRFAAINCDIDEEHFSRIKEEAHKHCEKVLTFGEHPGADYYGHSPASTPAKLSFTLEAEGMSQEITVSVGGYFNVSNALAAIAMTRAVGVPFEYILEGLAHVTVPGRMELHHLEDKNVDVIVDYAHNKVSYEALFNNVNELYPGRKKMLVVAVVGNKAFNRRRELGEVAEKYVDKVVLTEQDIGTDDIHQIWSDIRQFLSDDKVQAEIPIRREAVYYACENVPDGWVLILAGNGAERFQKRGLVCVPEPTDGEVVEKYIEDHR